MGANHQHQRARAVELLLAGRTHIETAAEVGVRRETIWRWTQDPGFAGELEQGRTARRRDASTELDAATLDAVRCLRALVNAQDAPAMARVRAATAILDRAGPMPAAEQLPADREGYIERTLANLKRVGLIGEDVHIGKDVHA